MKWSQHIRVLARLTGNTEFVFRRQDDDQYIRVCYEPRFLGSYIVQDQRLGDGQCIHDSDDLDAHLAACDPVALVETLP